MSIISRLVLVVLVLSGSIMASSHEEQLPSTSVSNWLELPDDNVHDILHHLPSMHDFIAVQRVNNAGYKATVGRIPNISTSLAANMLGDNYMRMFKGIDKFQGMFIDEHSRSHHKLLLPSCLSLYTSEQRRTCLKNLLFFIAYDYNYTRHGWFTIPFQDLVYASMYGWEHDPLKDAKLDQFAMNMGHRLYGDIHLDKWSREALFHLVDLRERLQRQSNGDGQAVKAVQDAISAALCDSVARHIKPAPSTISVTDFRQILISLHGYTSSAHTWMNVARSVVLNADRVSYKPLAGVKACYDLRPSLYDIIRGVRDLLPAESMAHATAELDSLFTFNQANNAVTGPNAAVQFAEQLEHVGERNFYLSAMKFAFLGLSLPRGYLQSKPRAMATAALMMLVRYWALESFERREGTNKAQRAFAALKVGRRMKGVADLEELRSKVAAMTPVVVS